MSSNSVAVIATFLLSFLSFLVLPTVIGAYAVVTVFAAIFALALLYAWFLVRRSEAKPRMSPELASMLKKEWEKIVGNGFDNIEVESKYANVQRPLPPKIKEISERIAVEIEAARTRGNKDIWNGARFKLMHFIEGRTTDYEKVTLTLFLEKSDYSDFLAMKEYLDQADDIDDIHISRREHFVALDEAKEHVIPELHSDIGVALLVVTADNYLVLTKRKERLAVSAGLIHFSCHEGMARGGENPGL